MRARTVDICSPLSIEDHCAQPVVDVSPPKWHLGHTTWFFETFLLKKELSGYKAFHEAYAFLFNSYYNAEGSRVLRAKRGDLTRPRVSEIYAYRQYVDEHMLQLFGQETEQDNFDFQKLVELGLQHEQQHQELLITDIKLILGIQYPLFPAYKSTGTWDTADVHQEAETGFLQFDSQVHEVGFNGSGFCFDNELGRHSVLTPSFRISKSLVKNSDMLDFIADGGYQNSMLWHDEGWAWVNQNDVFAPLYWQEDEGLWQSYTLEGLKPIDKDQILKHISFYEAAALAEWKGLRLPTEFEWELASSLFAWGDRWEWTQSAYLPYPGFAKAAGALGEYNGKFMVNQMVLRGSSVATSPGHSRRSYRNFFHPHLRWQYTGIRLAQTV